MLAALAWSSAGILQRQLRVDAVTQIGDRSVFAFVALAGYALWQRRDTELELGRGGLLVSAAMCVSTAGFFLALNHTTVAHVLSFQAVAPLLAAAAGAVMLGESVSRRMLVAMAVAVAGVVVMVGGPGGGSALGDGLALLTACAFALVIVMARRHRGVSMVTAICLSQLLLIVACAVHEVLEHRREGGRLVRAARRRADDARDGLFAQSARLLSAAEMALI